MGRYTQIIIALILTVVVGAIFYYAVIDPTLRRQAYEATMIDTNAQTDNTTTTKDLLTGLPVRDHRNYFTAAVMYDNFDSVKVRQGLEKASVVYEALAEGGITRLMAIFASDQEVRQFGPIRSVRPYFIDWAEEYGGILMHVGGSPDAVSRLRGRTSLINVDQIGVNESYFYRDESTKAPHNVFSSYSSWLKLGERLQVPTTTVMSWNFEQSITNAARGSQQMDILFSPTNHVTWVYESTGNSYLRFLNGERQLLATGDQVAASTVIMIEVKTRTIDSIGRQKMETIGTGSASIYRNGSKQQGTWAKTSPTDRMRFIDAQGNPMPLTPGVIWIEVVPSMSSVIDKQGS